MPNRSEAPAPPPLPVQTSSTPSPVIATETPEEIRNRELREKALALREAPRAVPVTDLAVIIGMKTRDGGRQEVVYDVTPKHRILKCSHEVVEKVRAVTEDGQFIGFEPTGEYEFTLKVKYLKEG